MLPHRAAARATSALGDLWPCSRDLHVPGRASVTCCDTSEGISAGLRLSSLSLQTNPKPPQAGFVGLHTDQLQ